MQFLGGRICPTIWMERKSAVERRDFLEEVMKGVNEKSGVPILLFPEGYCSNNTQVLQFRRSIFKKGITIYPIAIKQDCRFGDSFWADEEFYMYLLRVMSSWAISYDVTYLDKMCRFSQETEEDFAARAQKVVSNFIGVPACEFSGLMWYSKSEQRRLLEVQKKTCASAIMSYMVLDRSESNDGYHSVCSRNIDGLKHGASMDPFNS
ncbi:hypothetical protein DICVIV_01776 [Dictyocaulus viviparus]|uniref:Phospholipid/glycerol acyltransferase domain-containing protein n=1 Tax=Dictyocaulus viviparus TaxID=29172 RepID=A0A0D8Y7V1_DICVI|nr:hypothetical protein DICVIV_01776 [Dictyocaulus viviparus]